MKTIEYWLARIVFATPNLARFYVGLLRLLVRRWRKVAFRNLELAGFSSVEHKRIIDGMFDSIANVLNSFARFPELARSSRRLANEAGMLGGKFIPCEGIEEVFSAMRRRRGVLVATAHLGNWELSAFYYAMRYGMMHLVVRPLDNPKVDAIVERYRCLSGNDIITKRHAAREILRALRKGDMVGILIDQNVLPSEGVFIDFFGVQACAGTAFVKLAHHSGAAVFPGFLLWEPKQSRYVLRFYPEIQMTGDVQQDTQRVHSFLESVIRQYPDQYLWIHRRWKTRPPGAPDLYGT